ncbi:MAG: hypothetical protein DSY43_02940 [Gammaproteobacteria bacterium]|nr:MAG: hypothetical protein DSY43_02940 [Gammaproteobacteria bacterium]
MNEEESLLWLRFIGEDLNIKSLPIYELGTVLIAFQQIINKAYLFEKQSLTKGAKLSPSEREKCALQIGAHRKSSDEYGFITFVTDPVVIDHVKTLVVDAVFALGVYASGKAVSKNEKEPNNQYFIGSIYNQVTVINDRIENIGGVESIEIRGGNGVEVEKVSFTTETQSYVRQLENETFLGEMQEIKGSITKLYPNRLIAEIKIAPAYYTKVFLNENDFDVVRYKTKTGDVIKFTGRPIYRLGQKTAKIREFEGVSIVDIENEF